MARVYNFSSGPAALPEEVLKKAQREMLDWQGVGMSVMEMSHRSKEFISILDAAKKGIRDLLHVPDNYEILFMQGGASTLFAQIPANLAQGFTTVSYLDTGVWSSKAIKEASKYANVNIVASSKEQKYTSVPNLVDWNINPESAYLHIVQNETIGGVEFDQLPETDLPIVADLSSTILSRKIDVSKYALIYAGAQKNIGPVGSVLVIIRNDMLERSQDDLPTVWNFKQLALNDSMINTPPTYSIYLAGLVLEWLLELGGVEQIEQVNIEKARRLYQKIDSSRLYSNPVDPNYRSRMNVPFILADESLNQAFLAEAENAGLKNLSGHRSVGGMRASIYNAMPLSGVDALIEFMSAFERKYGY